MTHNEFFTKILLLGMEKIQSTKKTRRKKNQCAKIYKYFPKIFQKIAKKIFQKFSKNLFFLFQKTE